MQRNRKNVISRIFSRMQNPNQVMPELSVSSVNFSFFSLLNHNHHIVCVFQLTCPRWMCQNHTKSFVRMEIVQTESDRKNTQNGGNANFTTYST